MSAGITFEEFNQLPVGSVVAIDIPDQGVYQVIRSRDNEGASAGGFAILGGRHWTEAYTWGRVTILYTPDPPQ